MNDIKNLCEAAIFFGAVLSFVSFFMAGAVARGAVGTMLSLFFALAGIGGLFVGYWGASRLPLAQNVGLVLERARELREDEAKLQAPARGRRVGGGSR